MVTFARYTVRFVTAIAASNWKQLGNSCRLDSCDKNCLSSRPAVQSKAHNSY